VAGSVARSQPVVLRHRCRHDGPAAGLMEAVTVGERWPVATLINCSGPTRAPIVGEYDQTGASNGHV
jgi:hypothetical protein